MSILSRRWSRPNLAAHALDMTQTQHEQDASRRRRNRARGGRFRWKRGPTKRSAICPTGRRPGRGCRNQLCMNGACSAPPPCTPRSSDHRCDQRCGRSASADRKQLALGRDRLGLGIGIHVHLVPGGTSGLRHMRRQRFGCVRDPLTTLHHEASVQDTLRRCLTNSSAFPCVDRLQLPLVGTAGAPFPSERSAGAARRAVCRAPFQHQRSQRRC